MVSLAGESAAKTMQHQHRRFGAWLTFLMMAAVVGPYVGELAGWLPATTTFVPEGLLLSSPALRGGSGVMTLLALLYPICVIAIAGWLGNTTRASELAARRQLHLQTWHLRQLVSR